MLCFNTAFAASDYESFSAEAVAVRLSIPSGYEAAASSAAEGVRTAGVFLTWPEGPYAGLEILLTSREASCANVAIWAGFYQRWLGASSSFETDGEPLGGGELAAAGVDDGLRSSFAAGEGEGKRRVEALFLKRDGVFYLVRVSYPEAAAAVLGAAAQKILSSVQISSRTEERSPEASDGSDVGQE